MDLPTDGSGLGGGRTREGSIGGRGKEGSGSGKVKVLDTVKKLLNEIADPSR